MHRLLQASVCYGVEKIWELYSWRCMLTADTASGGKPKGSGVRRRSKPKPSPKVTSPKVRETEDTIPRRTSGRDRKGPEKYTDKPRSAYVEDSKAAESAKATQKADSKKSNGKKPSGKRTKSKALMVYDDTFSSESSDADQNQPVSKAIGGSDAIVTQARPNGITQIVQLPNGRIPLSPTHAVEAPSVVSESPNAVKPKARKVSSSVQQKPPKTVQKEVALQKDLMAPKSSSKPPAKPVG